MKALAFALSAALALALAACASDRSSSTRSSSSGGTSGSTSTEIKKDAKNATLTTKVKSALAADVGLKTLTGIDVDSEGSVVTLKGSVDTEANKRRAEQLARGVDGVSTVRNQLTVRSGG
jgi:hyperosmotically inducible periplasmic protein